MKKRYYFPGIYLSAVILVFLFSLSSSVTDHKSISVASLDPLNLSPNLPEVPFEYGDIDFPEHLIETEWGMNDPGILEFIDDDIATLGRVLFYDEILSANQNIACATCHSQAKSFADEVAFSMGVNTETRRNSLQLNDLGWSNNMGFFWDLSQEDMSSMISLPLKDENEIGAVDMDDLAERMNETSYYPSLFKKAFGNEEISESKITDAIMHFISSMVTFESRFDQVSRGDLSYTLEENRGHQVFEQTCGICHSQGNSIFFFIDIGTSVDEMINAFPFMFSNGLEPLEDDKGVGEWMPGMNHLFKVPTLRNIVQTAPYMHDGRLATLEDVIDHYSEDAVDDGWGFVPPGGFQFTATQKSDLLAFLETLTDESFLTDQKWSDPFERENSDVDEVDLLASMSVGPNPATDYTELRLDNPNQEMVEIYLLDLSGKLIRKQSTHTHSVFIDVSNLQAGNYILDIRGGNQKVSKTLLVL